MEFSLGAEGGWHVHFMPPWRLVNSGLLCSPRLLLSLPSSTPPYSSPSHHRAALNVLLFLYLFVCFHSNSQIPGTYGWLRLASVRVIEKRDRNVLIRSPQTRGRAQTEGEGREKLARLTSRRLLSARCLRVSSRVHSKRCLRTSRRASVRTHDVPK